MYTCSPDSPCELHALSIITWNHGCPFVAWCMCPSSTLLVPHLVWKMYMHQYIYAYSSESRNVFHPLCIVIWKHGCSCMALCLCPSNLISVPTYCLECVHASVHVFMSTWLPMLAKPPMDSSMATWVPMCGTVCVCVCVCPHHLTCGSKLWSECVHALVHVYMSAWLPMSA